MPYVAKMDADNFPSLYLSISSDVYDDLQLTQIVQDSVKTILEKLETIGQVEIYGAKDYSMRIEPDPITVES